MLIETLKSKGPNALLDLLRSLPSVGHISTTTSTGSSLRFAQSKPDRRRREADHHRHRAAHESRQPATTRPPRADADYPFSAVDIRFDRDGSGAGTLAYASKLAHNREDRRDRDRQLRGRSHSLDAAYRSVR